MVTKRSASEYRFIRKVYDAAFRRWSNGARSGDHSGCGERLYRRRRDEMAGLILRVPPGEHSAAMERLARSLWERAGRPASTIESDLLRAQTFVSSLRSEALR